MVFIISNIEIVCLIWPLKNKNIYLKTDGCYMCTDNTQMYIIYISKT